MGDSSGFFGVRPNIINSYLNGLKYINLSCCSDAGWDGYLYTANYYLKNNQNAKYLVLYFTPYHLPSNNKNFSKDLKEMFGGIENKDLFRFFKYIPSLYYRTRILDFVYQTKIEDKSKEYKRVMNNLGIAKDFEKFTGYKTEKLFDYLSISQGWLPYDRKENFKNMNINECGRGIVSPLYGKYGNRTLKKYLQKFKLISKRYDTKLVVLFNPVACKMSDKIKPILKK